MFVCVLNAQGIRRSGAAIKAGQENEYLLRVWASHQENVSLDTFMHVVEILKLYPHPDAAALDDPMQIRATADYFTTPPGNPSIIFGYGGRPYDRDVWRPFTRIPVRFAINQTPERLATIVLARGKKWRLSKNSMYPPVSRFSAGPV